MFGPDYFCAAIPDDIYERDVQLPEKGRWIDYWDETKVYQSGKQLENYDVPLDRYPIFIRAGSIIPMNVKCGETGHGTDASAGQMTVLMYPWAEHGKSSQTIYRQDEAAIEMAMWPRTNGWKITAGPADLGLILRVRLDTAVEGVEVNGMSVPELGDMAAVIAADGPGWCYDADAGLAWVRLPDSAALREVVVMTE
jgi:hypothetical protein